MEPERKRSRTLNDYRIIKQLGKGAFGKVYLAINPAGKKIALKVIDIPEDKPYLFEQTRNELSYLQRLAQPQCSPHVICYYGGYENREENQFLIEMEYIDGLELDKYIERLRQTQPPKVIYYYLLLIAKAVTDGLNYSHLKGIVHNDIKPANIMIDSKNVPRVVDFGVACSSASKSGRYCVSTGGSPNFIPPEFIIQNNTRYPASDMWALGVTLYYLATGQYPFDFSNAKTFGDIFAIIRDNEPRKLNTTNQQLNNLVNGLLDKNPNRRLSGNQVIDMLNEIPQPGVGPVVAQVPNVPLAQVPDRNNLGTQPMDISLSGTQPMNVIPQPRVGPVVAQVPDRNNLGTRPMDISLSDTQPMNISKSNLRQRSKLNNMDKKSFVMSLIF